MAATKSKKAPIVPVLKKLPKKKKSAAHAAVYEWRSYAYAVLDALLQSGADLKAELSLANSPLRDTIPLWAVKEFINNVGDGQMALMNLNIEPEVEVYCPDPLAGIYPKERKTFNGRHAARQEDE